jgi:hypothetical protein
VEKRRKPAERIGLLKNNFDTSQFTSLPHLLLSSRAKIIKVNSNSICLPIRTVTHVVLL